MKIITMKFLAVAIAAILCLSPAAWAAEKDGSNAAADAGIGAASFLCSIPYGAAKVVVALLGGITGAFTYVLSGFDKKAADSVWYTTMEGDYIVTPDHLRGKKDLRFTGVPPDEPKGGR